MTVNTLLTLQMMVGLISSGISPLVGFITKSSAPALFKTWANLLLTTVGQVIAVTVITSDWRAYVLAVAQGIPLALAAHFGWKKTGVTAKVQAITGDAKLALGPMAQKAA